MGGWAKIFVQNIGPKQNSTNFAEAPPDECPELFCLVPFVLARCTQGDTCMEWPIGTKVVPLQLSAAADNRAAAFTICTFSNVPLNCAAWHQVVRPPIKISALLLGKQQRGRQRARGHAAMALRGLLRCLLPPSTRQDSQLGTPLEHAACSSNDSRQQVSGPACTRAHAECQEEAA